MFSSSSESIYDSELNVSTQWENLCIYDEGQARKVENENSLQFIDDRGLRIMQKMGYKSGSGLGKNEQGVTKAINITSHIGKGGLGLDKNIEAQNENWDFTKEEVGIRETIIWLENQENRCNLICLETMLTWIKEGAPKHAIENEDNFCDKDVLQNVLRAKNIFDELNLLDLCQARTKANPFETIRSVFFMNRAALKMANIDAVTGFIFTDIDQNTYHKNHTGPFYFADICAGPGGFTEYILWRKQWFFKGFGLTLKGENDFKLHESTCASPVTFQALYGKLEDGNVCCPDNIEDFRDKVLHSTDGEGVHFVMSDGGFSVEGKENLQEVLSKNIYICQCLIALEVIRTHGHFVTKLFDVFTSFSVGLLYLMYKCFEKVTILKPNSSRPANSERYFICANLKEGAEVENIKKYLWIIVRRLWDIKDTFDVDILEIVPLDIIKEDSKFYEYISDSNNSLGRRQTIGLQKLATFCRNPSLVDTRQEELRKKSLDFWKIPNIARVCQPQVSVDQLLNMVIDNPEILLVQPREINDVDNFNLSVSDVEDWHYCPMYSSRVSNNCSFFAGLGSSKVYRLQRNKWVRVKNLQLLRGTLLYGEFLKEKYVLRTNVTANPEQENYKYSLHVIDALQLGEKSLADMRFKERIELIRVYCKSVNKELTPHSVRIRPKVMTKLPNIVLESSLKKDKLNGNYTSPLPILGYNTFSEKFDVNSMLLLKTNDNQSFQSTYVLRVQIFINSTRDQNEDECFSLENLITQVKQKL